MRGALQDSDWLNCLSFFLKIILKLAMIYRKYFHSRVSRMASLALIASISMSLTSNVSSTLVARITVLPRVVVFILELPR